MQFSKNPIAFLDEIIDVHKNWLRERLVASETLAYMGENVDQAGRGLDYMRHYVHNDAAERPDPNAPDTDLALLQLYEHWRSTHNMRPIEAWNGTRLRPWLPSDGNPKLPALLAGDLSDLKLASYRGEPWQNHVDRSHTQGPAELDVLGNAVESYFDLLRRFDVWSVPSHTNPHPTPGHGNHGGHGHAVGPMRLYRHNDFNNIEVSPYSIRFWGFLKWVDSLRRKVTGEPNSDFAHDQYSDITFMDKFNQNHFPWHDDIFNNGVCPDWKDQYGLRKHHKFGRNLQGYGLEFLEFHGDLLKEYNVWLERMGYSPTSEWREGTEPFVPGVHNSAYILRSAFSKLWPTHPWGRGYSNGAGMDYHLWGTDLFDADLTKFESIAELGYYFEGYRSIHGFGHLEHCDYRDQYLNNYSLRFFHWHQWIDDLYQKMKQKGKPLIKQGTTMDDEVATVVDTDKFTPAPAPSFPLTGTWRYRSYVHEPKDNDAEALWFAADMRLVEHPDGRLEGELDSGHPDYKYKLEGFINQRHVKYDTEPDWYDDRVVIVLQGRGATPATEGHVYDYRGHLSPTWPNGVNQIASFTGSMSRSARPDDRTKEGTIGSFVATKIGD